MEKNTLELIQKKNLHQHQKICKGKVINLQVNNNNKTEDD